MANRICSCGGPVELVLTQNDDSTETFGPECLECGADFSAPNEEALLDPAAEDGFRVVPRPPE